MKSENLTKAQIQEKIRKVNDALAQEGMPLTREMKQNLYDCIIGKSTPSLERAKLYQNIGGSMSQMEKSKSGYCYKNSPVLINKLDIRDEEELMRAERDFVSLRAFELTEKPLKGNFDFEHLKKIHKYLFQDIYSWAGDIRTCEIAKADLFCLSGYIDTCAQDIFNQLKRERYFTKYSDDETLNKLVYLLGDINALHPFREGNGRTQRFFIESLSRINGIDLDLTRVSKEEMTSACHLSVKGNYDKLMKLFQENHYVLSKEEKLGYINLYCSTPLKKELKRK